jgi:hypothetical protein
MSDIPRIAQARERKHFSSMAHARIACRTHEKTIRVASIQVATLPANSLFFIGFFSFRRNTRAHRVA